MKKYFLLIDPTREKAPVYIPPNSNYDFGHDVVNIVAGSFGIHTESDTPVFQESNDYIEKTLRQNEQFTTALSESRYACIRTLNKAIFDCLRSDEYLEKVGYHVTVNKIFFENSYKDIQLEYDKFFKPIILIFKSKDKLKSKLMRILI